MAFFDVFLQGGRSAAEAVSVGDEKSAEIRNLS